MRPSAGLEKKMSLDNKSEREESRSSKLTSHGSRTLKQAIQQYTAMQVWDWLFASCESNSKSLYQEGLINGKDIQDYMVKGNCKKLTVKLPAWSILECLLRSAKSDSSGLILSDQVELTRFNLPRDKMLQWFIEPLFTMKEQIKGLQLEENEEACLKKLIIACKNDRPEDWDEAGFPSDDKVRRAQLQALIRRLQGIVGSMSRLPTFRRRFRNLLKVLYVEAIPTEVPVDGTSKSGLKGRLFFGRGGRKRRDAAAEDHERSTIESGVMV